MLTIKLTNKTKNRTKSLLYMGKKSVGKELFWKIRKKVLKIEENCMKLKHCVKQGL